MIKYNNDTKTHNTSYIGDSRESHNQSIHGSTYICKIYLCKSKSVDKTCYCVDHTTPLRTSQALFTPGSAPIIRKTNLWRQRNYSKGPNPRDKK